MNRRTALVAFLVMAISACASMRKIEVGSGAATSTRISVHNSHSSTLTVSYADSKGTSHELGTIASGQTLPFFIPGTQGATVTIMGMTSGGGHYEKTATLGSTTSITL
jgi:hypothetical protein